VNPFAIYGEGSEGVKPWTPFRSIAARPPGSERDPGSRSAAAAFGEVDDGFRAGLSGRMARPLVTLAA